MSEMVGVATWSVTSFVTARLSPCSMRKVARVIRKLGIPVWVTIQPLKNPMASAIASAMSDPTQDWRCQL